MKGIKRAAAILLLVTFTYSLLSVYPPLVHAATAPVNIYVDKYEAGKLDFHWDAVAGTTSVVITYHVPVAGSSAADIQTVTLSQTTNTASISGLKTDYIYDIDVKLYDQAPSGLIDPIGHGLLYYIPKITFYAAAGDQSYEEVAGGGRETGGKPNLQLKWIMPRAYSTSGIYEEANNSTVLTEMQNELNSVYNDGRTISSLNFRVNISSDFTKLNSGSSQAAVLIEQNGTGYKASVSGGSTTVDVLNSEFPGYMSLQLWGRSDPAANLPDASDGLGAGDLPHADIYPGSVYYMNIKPVFKNSAGANVNAISVGNPADQNGSMLSGTTKYAYTSIRFQLSKDSANNIYVKIYKINQGSLDLPRLYYQVQSSDDPSVPGDWIVRKTMDDTYFSGDSAITVVSGVNANNEIYYKIVVKSDSPNDRLESAKLPYMLSIDTSRPPVPVNIAVTKRELVYRTNPDGTVDKTTDVTLQWDKPYNWDTIKAEADAGKCINYYLAINTNQTESTSSPYPVLEAEGKSYGAFPLRYRIIAYVSARDIVDTGNRLEYTIKGFELFKGGYWDGTYQNGKPVIVPDDFSQKVNTENYPNMLLPNKIYYLQMFSSMNSDRAAILDSPNYFAEDYEKMSDRSVVTSFTTLKGTEMDVPLPANLRLDNNTVVNNTTLDGSVPVPLKVNQVEILFDKVIIKDWSNYTNIHDNSDSVCYDVYMNTRTDTPFMKIASTDVSNTDVVFTGLTDGTENSIRMAVSKFSPEKSPEAYAAFGEYLRPNTTYYFYVKTRLSTINTVPGRQSENTAVLPVTTVNVSITPPDDSLRKPLAPDDFAIATDASGNQRLTGYSVTFSWLRKENDVKYELICTGSRVLPGDAESTYSGDPYYTSFINTFDKTGDGVADGRLLLDPADWGAGNSGCSYDSTTGLCTYTISNWLFPNRLYYFSLRAVRKNTAGTASVWVSIPVTTSLIEGPQQLEVVSDGQLGFYWTDTDPVHTAEDFYIYMKGPDDADYKLVTRSQSSIVKDNSTYYGRVTGLKLKSSYSFRVYRGAGTGTLVYEKTGMMTRDGCHELVVRWKGLQSDDFSGYELAVRSEYDQNYSTIDESGLESYQDPNGRLLPYYVEENAQTAGNQYAYYYAKIKMSEVELSTGISVLQPLQSNMKYYIKVRARKQDPFDLAAIAYSKYAGPVSQRTEFSQSDYDNSDIKETGKAVFLDKIKELEKSFYWRLDSASSTLCKVILKSSIISSALKNSREDRVVVDLSDSDVNMNSDMVYIPVSVISALEKLNKNLEVRTSDADFLLRPRTINLEQNQDIKALKARNGVKDVYIVLKANRSQTASGLPSGLTQDSLVNDYEVQAVPAVISETELAGLVYNKLYNKSSGLVSQKLNLLANTYTGTGTAGASILDEIAGQLLKMLESELSSYLNSTVEASKITGAVKSITKYSTPPAVKLYCYSSQGYKNPYVKYDGAKTWQKLTADVVKKDNTLKFNPAMTGQYVVLLSQASAPSEGTSSDYQKNDSISRFLSAYDVSDIFPDAGTAFASNDLVTCRELVLLYEKVTGRTAENAGLDIKDKSKKLKLDSIISSGRIMKNATRQEAAGVLAKLLALKKNLDAENLVPGSNIYINDDSQIDENLYNFVLIVLDRKIMTLDSNGNFNAKANINRAGIITAMVRLLEQTGDMETGGQQ